MVWLNSEWGGMDERNGLGCTVQEGVPQGRFVRKNSRIRKTPYWFIQYIYGESLWSMVNYRIGVV